MKQINSILNLPLNCVATSDFLSRVFIEEGLKVERSFDLQSACSAFSDNICPSHGESPCDCQLIVLLVYDHVREQSPISILMHGHSEKTQLGLFDYAIQAPSIEFEERIRAILAFSNVKTRLKEYAQNAI